MPITPKTGSLFHADLHNLVRPVEVMDYGAPVGWRLALKHPERITALIVQAVVGETPNLAEGRAPAQV